MNIETKSNFQKKFEDLLEQNKRLFEDVELQQVSADHAAAQSANLFKTFVNDMRYPSEVKAHFASGMQTENTQMFKQ